MENRPKIGHPSASRAPVGGRTRVAAEGGGGEDDALTHSGGAAEEERVVSEAHVVDLFNVAGAEDGMGASAAACLPARARDVSERGGREGEAGEEHERYGTDLRRSSRRRCSLAAGVAPRPWVFLPPRLRDAKQAEGESAEPKHKSPPGHSLFPASDLDAVAVAVAAANPKKMAPPPLDDVTHLLAEVASRLSRPPGGAGPSSVAADSLSASISSLVAALNPRAAAPASSGTRVLDAALSLMCFDPQEAIPLPPISLPSLRALVGADVRWHCRWIGLAWAASSAPPSPRSPTRPRAEWPGPMTAPRCSASGAPSRPGTAASWSALAPPSSRNWGAGMLRGIPMICCMLL
ncbi:uncharacterized protein [Triticum aestivum]|uniref:uncharacterized protein n=1 Tax=Triticum aestivum TaxID=4565 RepID=UPI001D016B87|nr:uncharacterized protein LOC123153022 [Triticum aestivum]